MKMIYRIWLVVICVLLVAAVGLGQAQDADTPLLLQGQVTDTTGAPIEGAVVEIWQTDVNGVYNHPESSSEDERDPDFQYFGTSTTDAEGYYAFLTYVPGEYEPRPVHIHFKVKIEGEDVLTSQFYFEEDRETVEDGGTVGGEADDTIFLMLEEALDEEENPIFVANKNIVLDLGNGGDLTPTAAQGEGPFYPTEDFADFDNNLISTADDDEIVQPLLIDAEDVVAEGEAVTVSGRALYRITPENAGVQFILQEDLRGQRIDVIGTTDQVAADVIIDFDTPFLSQVGVITINARTLQTDNQFRDRAIRAEILLSSRDEYEFIDFTPLAINGLPDTVVVGETYAFEIVGNLNMVGVVNEVTFTTEVTIVSPSQIAGTASTTILYADWGISIPSAPGVANISDDVTLIIDFVADQVEQ